MHPCIFISSTALNRQNIFAKVSDIAVKTRFFCSALRLVIRFYYSLLDYKLSPHQIGNTLQFQLTLYLI